MTEVTERYAGQLLIATPQLVDANFFRTVVLVIDHNEEGAMGLVLNRPSTTATSEPLPRWADLSAEPAVVFVGGPMRPTAAFCLGRLLVPTAGDGWRPLFEPLDALGSLDLEREPGDLPVERLRVFVGYSGWDKGQLEAEIAAGAWWVVPAEPNDVLTADPDDLWRLALRRQGGALRTVSTYPADPALN